MLMPCHRGAEGHIASNATFSYPHDLREAIRVHWQAYYQRFGIRNIGDHVAQRLVEESVECRRLRVHETYLNRQFHGRRALVVGLGTGGLTICLHALGNDVHGVEPDKASLQIAWRKMAFVGGEKARLLPGVAEALPYSPNTFDYIFCYTVLEHVRDVRRSLHEMVRVLKSGGVILLNTPEYRFPFETHYKVPVLLKPFPRWVSALILKLAGKPPGPLFREITYVTSKQIQHQLMEIPNLRFFRVFTSYPDNWRKGCAGLSAREQLIYGMFRFWSRRLEIYQNQEYYVFKIPLRTVDEDRVEQDQVLSSRLAANTIDLYRQGS